MLGTKPGSLESAASDFNHRVLLRDPVRFAPFLFAVPPLLLCTGVLMSHSRALPSPPYRKLGIVLDGRIISTLATGTSEEVRGPSESHFLSSCFWIAVKSCFVLFCVILTAGDDARVKQGTLLQLDFC